MSKPLRFELLGETLSKISPGARARSELADLDSAPTLSATPTAMVASPPMAAPTPTVVLDPAALAQLRELESIQPGLLAELSRTFLAEAAVNLEDMRRALATQNHQAIGEAAHTLKGSSYTLGARAVGDVAAEVEAASRASQDTAELLVALERAIAASRPALEALASRPG